MKRYFSLSLFFLLFLFPHLARALDMPFKQVAPDIYAFIGETGLRTYENEGMNGNAGFIVTQAGVVVVDSGSSYQVAQTIHAAIRKVTKQPVKYQVCSQHRRPGSPLAGQRLLQGPGRGDYCGLCSRR